ncbi:unnamed protein product, partial [Ectocarpus sp. 4 AP-2014]
EAAASRADAEGAEGSGEGVFFGGVQLPGGHVHRRGGSGHRRGRPHCQLRRAQQPRADGAANGADWTEARREGGGVGDRGVGGIQAAQLEQQEQVHHQGPADEKGQVRHVPGR